MDFYMGYAHSIIAVAVLDVLGSDVAELPVDGPVGIKVVNSSSESPWISPSAVVSSVVIPERSCAQAASR